MFTVISVLSSKGRVRFDEDGTRIVDSFEIKQYRMDSSECDMSLCHVTVGAVNVTSETFRFIGNNDNGSVWPGETGMVLVFDNLRTDVCFKSGSIAGIIYCQINKL